MLLNNRYKFIRKIGEGGFGETFLSEDTQMPSHRYCVIKRLRPIEDNPQVHHLVQQRFQREAAILEELGNGSPQIPYLYAYFSDNGQFYLVQEYIEGHTCTEKIQKNGLMTEVAVKEILISLLYVLDYIHSKGIVHRDIKPDNIIIRNDDGKPVLIDFGAIKETVGNNLLTTSGNLTNSIVIGTPGFMAPEQSIGRPIFSSDLYSLGLTAVYLLTGKQPQELTDTTTTNFVWRQYRPDLSSKFASVLDKAIQFERQERFTTTQEMLAALQNQIISLPKNNQKVILLSSVILGMVVGVPTIVWLANRDNAEVAISSPDPGNVKKDTRATDPDAVPVVSENSPSPSSSSISVSPTPTTNTTIKYFIGVQMATLTPQLKENWRQNTGWNISSNEGIMLVHIYNPSPASQAKLRAGDVIFGVNGKFVSQEESFQEIVQNSQGQQLVLQVERQGQTGQIVVIPAPIPRLSQ
ncbi:protein kinase domain-containing protein [Calothrix rhizosoleniae]|uniref:protein kinase domain-containing protein n=1 Tax=Calothrix rhizosoleniae TaxID=888997 RepID=UPI000B498B9A|nr:protein kinase [Calothrix rhizosoleniae]